MTTQVWSLWKEFLFIKLDRWGWHFWDNENSTTNWSEEDGKYDIILVCVKLSIHRKLLKMWLFFCGSKKNAVADFIYLRFIWYENSNFCWFYRFAVESAELSWISWANINLLMLKIQRLNWINIFKAYDDNNKNNM